MTEHRRCSDNGKYPSWRWLAGILLFILIAMISYFVGGYMSDSKADTRTLHTKLEDTNTRLTKVETNYEHIIQTLDEATRSMKRAEVVLIRVEQKVDDHLRVGKK